MAVYFVTGKLGSGKTLAAVGKIRDALLKGLPVATNLDLKLHKLLGTKSKKCRVYRLPDKPTVDDMRAIGIGNTTYDETKNGLIVLDECGTWFNARDWQDKDRRPLIDWLLHARKLGWDIIFIIQDISMIDKQARKAVAEFVVYCRRLDRIKVPILDRIYKAIFDKELPKAKVHMGIVKYGDQPTSLTVDRWWYMGRDLYPAYDTKQIFSDSYPHGIYQVLPPYYTHGRYAKKRNLRFYMRLTKIYFRRFSRVGMLTMGIVAGSAIASIIQRPQSAAEVATMQEAGDTVIRDEQAAEPVKSIFSDSKKDDDAERPLTLKEKFAGYVVSGVATDKSGTPIFVEISNQVDRWNLQTLRAAGYVVNMISQCQVLIMNMERTDMVRLFTSYCPPSNPPSEPPRMAADESFYWRVYQLYADQAAKRR